MKLDLFNKDSNINILIAGIFALIIGVGVARFAFTSLLPSMLENQLTITTAGIMASFNFAGYLSGAIFSIFLKDIHTKVKFFRLGLFLSVITTLVLAFSTNEILWIISRVVAGFGSAMLLIVAGSLVMLKLNFEDKTKAMGIHFSGIGIAIVFCELISQYVLQYSTWNIAWLVLASCAIIFSLYSAYILNFDNYNLTNKPTSKVSKNIFSSYVILLIVAYFTEGVGFVVQGTFLPDIINNINQVDSYGSLIWLFAGLAGIPASIMWMRLAYKYGTENIIMIAMLLQIIGILIPTFTNNIVINLLSGVLYGSTFIGLVALFMNKAGQISKNNPVIIMGSMTAAYGIGQVLAPLYSIYYINKYGNYDITLYITACIVFVGVLLIFMAKRKYI